MNACMTELIKVTADEIKLLYQLTSHLMSGNSPFYIL